MTRWRIDSTPTRAAQSGILIGLAVLLGTAAPAFAETAVETPEPSWEFVLEPYLWVASIDGKIGSSQNPSPAAITFVDLLEQLKLAAMGAVSLRYKRVGVFGDANFVKVDKNVNLPPNAATGLTHVDVTAKVAFGTAGVFYRLRPTERLTLDPYIGARWWFVDLDLGFMPSPPGFRISPDRAWADFVVGLMLNYDITDRWFIEAAADVGGGASTVDWQGYAGTGYDLRDSVALSVGWRYIGVDYNQNGLLFDATLEGLLVGLKFRF